MSESNPYNQAIQDALQRSGRSPKWVAQTGHGPPVGALGLAVGKALVAHIQVQINDEPGVRRGHILFLRPDQGPNFTLSVNGSAIAMDYSSEGDPGVAVAAMADDINAADLGVTATATGHGLDISVDPDVVLEFSALDAGDDVAILMEPTKATVHLWTQAWGVWAQVREWQIGSRGLHAKEDVGGYTRLHVEIADLGGEETVGSGAGSVVLAWGLGARPVAVGLT